MRKKIYIYASTNKFSTKFCKTKKSALIRYFVTCFVHNIGEFFARRWHDSLSMYCIDKKSRHRHSETPPICASKSMRQNNGVWRTFLDLQYMRAPKKMEKMFICREFYGIFEENFLRCTTRSCCPWNARQDYAITLVILWLFRGCGVAGMKYTPAPTSGVWNL